MEWIKTIVCFLGKLIGGNGAGKVRAYKVDRNWIRLERDKVNEALKKKHGKTNGQK